MTYFPEPVFRNITSYLLDPDFYKKRHAEVWQKIRVKRVMESTMGFEEYEDTIRDCKYFVYIYDPNICDTEDVSIPTKEFGYDDLSGDWDNVEETIEWTHAGAFEYEWHNVPR